MPRLYSFVFILFLFADVALASYLLLHGKTIAVLSPQGIVASQERELMFIALLLGFLVVIPVFILAFFVAYTYREGKTAAYEPDWSGDGKLQAFWWIFPTLVIITLACITWVNTHKLDPRSEIAAKSKTMTIQVVALRWKWLFIYPQEGIATVNYFAIPEKTPINFELTADEAPMNSFWVPQLGGQIYAMSGMITQTHLIADNTGIYRGSNSEISGQGFAGMIFTVQSLSQSDYAAWVASVKQKSQALTKDAYDQLAKPSEDNKPVSYASTANNLYTTIVMKYMAHSSPHSPLQTENVPTEQMKMQGM